MRTARPQSASSACVRPVVSGPKTSAAVSAGSRAATSAAISLTSRTAAPPTDRPESAATYEAPASAPARSSNGRASSSTSWAPQAVRQHSTVRQSPGATRSSPARPALRTTRAHAPTFAGSSGRTSTTRTRVNGRLRRPFARGRDEVDVRVQPADLLVLRSEVDLQQVALRDHADEPPGVDDRQVAAAGLLHLPQPFFVRVRGVRDDEVARHHVGHARRRRVGAWRHHPAHDVALREDADEARPFQHRRRTHAPLRHVARGVPHRLLRRERVDLAIRDQRADRAHGSSSTSGGQGRWNRRRPPRRYSDRYARSRPRAAGSISTNHSPTPGGSDLLTRRPDRAFAHATRQRATIGISLPGRRKRSATVSPTGSGSGRSANAPSTPRSTRKSGSSAPLRVRVALWMKGTRTFPITSSVVSGPGAPAAAFGMGVMARENTRR